MVTINFLNTTYILAIKLFILFISNIQRKFTTNSYRNY